MVTLTNVAHLIQRRFASDVCSVYLLEPDRSNLVLAGKELAPIVGESASDLGICGKGREGASGS